MFRDFERSRDHKNGSIRICRVSAHPIPPSKHARMATSPARGVAPVGVPSPFAALVRTACRKPTHSLITGWGSFAQAPSNTCHRRSKSGVKSRCGRNTILKAYASPPARLAKLGHSVSRRGALGADVGRLHRLRDIALICVAEMRRFVTLMRYTSTECRYNTCRFDLLGR